MKKTKERQRTNEGLKAERTKTDRELVRRQADAESGADDQLADTRKQADAAVANARAVVDAGRTNVHRDVDVERRRQDEGQRREREEADERLDLEREEGVRELAKLLSLERGRTDQRLDVERVRADSDLASRDAFLAMVSHDLRDLLGAMAMGAALLARLPGGDLAEQVHREAHRMQRNVARMNRLVSDLQDIVSIEAGRLRIHPGRGALSALVEESVQAFAPLAASRGVALTGEVQPPSLVADFDHDRTLQVLANLLGNAIKFTPGGGSITLDVDQHGDSVRFRVSDTGPGLPEEQAEHVFQRFWQASPGDRRGLGIGLFISRSVVEAHGGRIWAEPRPGGGTTFTFTLPAPNR